MRGSEKTCESKQSKQGKGDVSPKELSQADLMLHCNRPTLQATILLMFALYVAEGIFLNGASDNLDGTRSVFKRSVVNQTELEDFDEGRCNSDKLQRIMRENMKGDYQNVSMNIMKYAEESMGGPFSVICARADFAYVTRARIYCLHSVDDLNCFAYLTEQ